MSHLVPASFQVKFQNNLEMQLQQQTNPLEGAVKQTDDASAESVKIKDIVGNNEGHEADERHGDTKHSNTPFDGVWVGKSNELYDSDLVDIADQLATSIQLGSATTMSLAGFIRRARIRRMLEGFYGPIRTGTIQNLVTTPFPNGNIIPATTGGASATGINVAKLLAADEFLAQQYVDTDMLEKYMVLTAQDNKRLLTEVPVTSSDFKSSYQGEVSRGKLRSLLGWTFIHLELDNPLLKTIPALATNGSGQRKTPFWAEGGLAANNWQRLRTMVDPRPDKLGSAQIFSGTTLTASRTQPGMSGIIENVKG